MDKDPEFPPMTKWHLYPRRNFSNIQKASDSSGTASRKCAAISFIPWQYPTCGSRMAYAWRTFVSRVACAVRHVGVASTDPDFTGSSRGKVV